MTNFELFKSCLAVVACSALVFLMFPYVALRILTFFVLTPYNLYLDYKYGELVAYPPQIHKNRFCPFRNYFDGKPLLYVIR